MSEISDINWLFKHYYKDNPELKRIVLTHSLQVAKLALKIVETKKLPLDPKDVYCAAFLHDIGVVKCYAPDIGAVGQLPYLQHGIEGMKILQNHGLHTYARVCLIHTGSGITAEEIKTNNLPLPQIDLVPETILEKLICYADKFFSKSQDLKKEKNIEEIISQMKKFGPEALERFLALNQLFSIS